MVSNVTTAPHHETSKAFWKVTELSVTGSSEIVGDAEFTLKAPREVAGAMLSKT